MNRIKKIINKLFGKNCSASSIGIIGGINGPTSIFTVKTNDEQKETANGIMRDIDLFKGVSQEDIDNRTPRFMGYVTTLLKYNK